MKKKNVLVVSILTLTVLASSSAMAFADSTATGATTTKDSDHKGDIRAELNLTDAQMTLLHEAKASDLKEALTNLVSAGTITQAEADAITSNMPTEKADRGDGPFQNLTEKQKTALKNELQTLKTSSLEELVSDGTITQDQADALAKQRHGAKLDAPDCN